MVFSIVELGIALALFLPCLIIGVGGLTLLLPFIVPAEVADAIGPSLLTALTLLLGTGLGALMFWGAVRVIDRLQAGHGRRQ